MAQDKISINVRSVKGGYVLSTGSIYNGVGIGAESIHTSLDDLLHAIRFEIESPTLPQLGVVSMGPNYATAGTTSPGN